MAGFLSAVLVFLVPVVCWFYGYQCGRVRGRREGFEQCERLNSGPGGASSETLG